MAPRRDALIRFEYLNNDIQLGMGAQISACVIFRFNPIKCLRLEFHEIWMEGLKTHHRFEIALDKESSQTNYKLWNGRNLAGWFEGCRSTNEKHVELRDWFLYESKYATI